MIRIMTEGNKKARADLENWLNSELTGNMQKAIPKLLNRFLGDEDDPNRDTRFAPKRGIKDTIQGQQKDMYWWMRESTPEEFAYFVRDYVPASVEKKFCRIYDREKLELLKNPQNRGKITKGRQSPEVWVAKYENMLARGTDEETAVKAVNADFDAMVEEDRLRTSEQLSDINAGSEIVYQGRGWTVVKVFNYAASNFYGSGSGWCTTGRHGNGESYFNNYMYGGNKRESCKYAKDGKPYYLMYFSPDGRKYNVLGPDCIYIGTGKADHMVDSLPDDVPISIEEATRGDEYRPQGFNR